MKVNEVVKLSYSGIMAKMVNQLTVELGSSKEMGFLNPNSPSLVREGVLFSLGDAS